MSMRQRLRNSPMTHRRPQGDVAFALALEAFSALKGELPKLQLESLRSKDFRAVVTREMDFSISDCMEFRDAYLATELVSKYPFWDIGYDKEAEALMKFRESEVTCTETNLRLSSNYVDGAVSPYTPRNVLLTARRKIARLLGPFSWDHAERHFGFGPGATATVPKRFGDAYYKYRALPSTTEENAILAYTAIRRVPRWYQHVVSLTNKPKTEIGCLSLPEQLREMFTFVPGNRIVTVPKNAKTDRTIAIEPTMNSYIQKGIGGMIRSKLKRVAVDLDDQTPNQKLALAGSIDGSLATIDLKSASDTVSLRLVEELLPSDWLLAIKQARSPVGVLPDGTVIQYQKVSSMGNAYTFELESLIFWALCSSVLDIFHSVDRRLAVYGDDIIVPSSVAHQTIWILNYCGFSCNTKKTFVSGPFRESCGKHYFRGVDVTPIYIRKDIASPDVLITFCNQVRRLARLSWGLDGSFKALYDKGVSYLPVELRKPTICDGFGDGALFGDFDECAPPRLRQSFDRRNPRLPSGFEGYSGLVHIQVCKTRVYGDVPYLVRSLSGFSAVTLAEFIRSPNGKGLEWWRELVVAEASGVPIPSANVTWKSVRIPIAQWDNLGPWLL